jgi:opacity protein-like surface antigen
MRRIVSSVLAGAAVAAAMTVAATPAAAVGSCASPNFCLFENNDFNQDDTNHWLDLTRDDYDLRNNYWYDNNGDQTNDRIDNETSSVKNRSGCNVRLWQDVGGTGAHTRIDNGHDDGFLANNAIGDNRLSAVDMCV